MYKNELTFEKFKEIFKSENENIKALYLFDHPAIAYNNLCNYFQYYYKWK